MARANVLRRGLLFCLACFVLCGAALAADDSVFVWGRPLPRSLDPHSASDLPMQFVALNVYDSLYRYEGEKSKNEPWLVADSVRSADGRSWIFRLRSGVKFHDGSELTSDDVVYSFQRVLALGKAPASPFVGLLKPENVRKVDAQTVRFTLNQPDATFLSALPLVSIVNSRLVKAHTQNHDWGQAWLSENEAGSGAYAIVPSSYQPNTRLDLVRFTDHFKGWSDNPYAFNLIRARPVRDATSRVLALLKNDIDITDEYLSAEQVSKIQKSKSAHVEFGDAMRMILIRMNNSRPPFNNVHFRKCISYAFNYDAFIDGIAHGNASRLRSPIPNELWGRPKNAEHYDFNPDKAREECNLAKSEGAPISRELHINIVSEFSETRQLAELLQSNLREIGIKLKVIPDTWPHLTSLTSSPQTTPDMWVHYLGAYEVDPDNWIGQMYGSKSAGTWKASSWYSNPEADELLAKAREELSQERRADLYEKVASLIVSEAVDVWVADLKQARGLSNRVSGFRFTPVGGGSELRWMFPTQKKLNKD